MVTSSATVLMRSALIALNSYLHHPNSLSGSHSGGQNIHYLHFLQTFTKTKYLKQGKIKLILYINEDTNEKIIRIACSQWKNTLELYFSPSTRTIHDE